MADNTRDQESSGEHTNPIAGVRDATEGVVTAVASAATEAGHAIGDGVDRVTGGALSQGIDRVKAVLGRTDEAPDPRFAPGTSVPDGVQIVRPSGPARTNARTHVAWQRDRWVPVHLVKGQGWVWTK